jgi:hypothetical protein
LPIGLLLAAAGCADDGDPAARCLPARLAVEPAQVEVGGQVTLSAPAAGCDLGYDDGAYYEVYLALLDHADAVDLGDVEVGEDGSFRAVLTVPADAPPGPASLGARGSAYDECPDDTTGGCAGYEVLLTLLPAG